MNLVQRITNICLNPKTEWPVIEAETHSAADLYKKYIIILSAIPIIASFIGMTMIGINIPFFGSMRIPMGMGLTNMVLSFGLSLVSIYVISLIVDALAPSFGGEKNPIQALKVVAFAFTPAWIAGILNIIPSLGILVLIASFYSIYVLYLGLPVLMKAPQEKAVAYTAVSVICAIVFAVISGFIVTAVSGTNNLNNLSAMHSNNKPVFDTNSPMGNLEQMSKQMEDAGKAMEKAQKSGDQQAQMSAATDALGAAFGGDGTVEVVEMAELKALLPDSLMGLKRKSIEGEKTAMGTFKISKAEARYADDNNRNIHITISDFGGNKMAAMMMGLGMIESEKETDHGYEKTYTKDGRYTSEEYQKDSSSGEYKVLVAKRFMMEIKGEQVKMDELKMAAQTIGFAKLEAMKNSGVK